MQFNDVNSVRIESVVEGPTSLLWRRSNPAGDLAVQPVVNKLMQGWSEEQKG